MKTLTLTLFARLGCAALLAASAACSGVAGNSETPVVAAKVSAPASSTLRQQMMAEIGNAACDSTAQCRSLPVGHRACGGPEAYLAYSTKTGDAGKLQRLAADEMAARKEQYARSGAISTCQMLMDPGAVCQAGRCVSGNANGGVLPTR